LSAGDEARRMAANIVKLPEIVKDTGVKEKYPFKLHGDIARKS
jgi:hypothetical protein